MTPKQCRNDDWCEWAPILEQLEPRTLLSGVTIITHGFQSDVDKGGWVRSMADAIATAHGGIGSVAQFILRVDNDGGTIEATSLRRVSGPVESFSEGNATGEVIILIDWSDLDGGINSGNGIPTGNVGAVVFDYLFNNPVAGQMVFELPIHMIGHSRGASLNTYLAGRLAQLGIWVDHFTTLDPHPVDGIFGGDPINFHDQKMAVWDNVVFADNYWQEGSTVNGEFVTGAYNVELDASRLRRYIPGGFQKVINPGYKDQFDVTDIMGSHSDVHLWYHGTIDTKINPLTDGYSGTTPVEEFHGWYIGNDSSGDPRGSRTQTGYAFSRLVDPGSRPTAGLKSSGASRISVPRSGSQADAWDNIQITGLNDDIERSVGQSINVSAAFEDLDGNAVITFGLDNDANPYTTSTIALKVSDADQGSGVARNQSIVTGSIPTAGAAPGTYHIYAQISQNGRTRYYYAPGQVEIVQAEQNAPVIQSVQPTQLEGLPSNQRQTLTIAGSGFGQGTSLKFVRNNEQIYLSNPSFLRVISSTRIEYDISVGTTPQPWTVQAFNGVTPSNIVGFSVVAGPDTTPPTARLASPVASGSIQQSAINGRAYVDVTFLDEGGSGLLASSILDAGAEFTLSGTGVGNVVINGAPTLVAGTSSTYRYAFTGSFGLGPVTVNFLTGSWADVAGNTNLGSSTSFVVSAQNTAPTITDISDRTIPQGGSTGAIPFVVGDAESPPSTLTTGIWSSNQSLIPNSNVVISGTGANRTISVTPVAGISGSSLISVAVADPGGLTASDSFVVTVVDGGPEIRVQLGNVPLVDDQSQSIDFGSVVQTQVGRSITFLVANDGQLPLNLSNVAVPLGYTLTDPLSPVLQPGQLDTFTVRLDSIDLGTQAGEIVLLSNDADEGTFNIPITGLVTPRTFPDIEVRGIDGTVIPIGSPTASTANGTDFGGADVTNGLVSRTFTLHNTGSADLFIDLMTFIGTNPLEFSFTESQPSSPTLGAGESFQFEVRFNPNAEGYRSAILRISSNDEDEQPYDIHLEGTGLGPTSPPTIGSLTSSSSTVVLGELISLTASNVTGIFDHSGDVIFFREWNGIPGLQQGQDGDLPASATGYSPNRSIAYYETTSSGLEPGQHTFYAQVQKQNGTFSVPHSIVVTVVPPFADDAREENDSPLQAMAAPAGAPNSPNLGLVTGERVFTGLRLADARDYFQFTLNSTGGPSDSVSISFLNSQGNLDLQLLKSGTLSFIGASFSSTNIESVSLNNQPPGDYIVYVYGSPNPDYTLTIRGPVNSPPSTQSLSATVEEAFVGDPLQLTANNVSDPEGIDTVLRVEFFVDSNQSGAYEESIDQLVGVDTSAIGGWTSSINTTGYPSGITRFFAVPIDEFEAAGLPVATSITLLDPPPSVKSVEIRGSSWSNEFLDYLWAFGLGASGYALPAPGSPVPPRVLPWIDVDQVVVRFSEDVHVQTHFMALHGVNSPLLEPVDVSYDFVDFTATWTFSTPISADKLLLVVNSGVTDRLGNSLVDGQFVVQASFLPGDVDGTEIVSRNDMDDVRGKQFLSAGTTGYDPMLDVDGSGVISARDVVLVRNRMFSVLPDGEPEIPIGGNSIGSTVIIPQSSPPRSVEASGDPVNVGSAPVTSFSLSPSVRGATDVRVIPPVSVQVEPLPVSQVNLDEIPSFAAAAMATWDTDRTSRFDRKFVPLATFVLRGSQLDEPEWLSKKRWLGKRPVFTAD